MKSLVLAEKPSVGKDLGRVLGCRQGGHGYLEGASWLVTWAMGHLVELADPSSYDVKYKSWNLEDLPMMPDKMKFKVIKRTAKQFNLIKTLMKRSDIGTLVIATDAGREGELVARLIMKLTSWKGPFKRLWIGSQTNQAIKEGFKHLKEGHAFDNLYKAALCRAEADWLIGLNVTRALSCRYDVRLSAGRVQTPTLNVIALREKEISNFIGKKFWTIKADFDLFQGVWQGNNGTTRFYNRQEAQRIIDRIRDSSAKVVTVNKTTKNVPPPMAYDLTALQRDANVWLGFSAKKTLSTLQVLYERHKIATYPRTDSSYITTDMVPTLSGRLKSLKNTSFAKAASNLLMKPVNPGKRFVNDAKVTEHHAIIPTGDPVFPERLDTNERKLMNLIIQRFLEVLSTPLQKEQSKITVTVEDEIFIAKGERVLSKGWSSISGEGIKSDEEGDIAVQNTVFPPEKSTLKIHSLILHEGMTKPPPRYTEGTLLGIMENPGAFVTDLLLKKTISQGGLGTVATRADIIEKIIANNYVQREGKSLRPTSRGLALLEIVPEELKSPILTARWEKRLSNIAEGKENKGPFLKEIREKTTALVQDVKKSTQKYKPVNTSGKKCPLCGRPMIQNTDRRGKTMYTCYSLSCGYEEPTDEGAQTLRRPGRKEKALNRKLISKYSDKSSSTSTFGDLIRQAEQRKK